jgi:hypothetical protein
MVGSEPSEDEAFDDANEEEDAIDSLIHGRRASDMGE